jgi:hypothetical protein
MPKIEIPYSVPMLPEDVPVDVRLKILQLEAVTDSRFLHDADRYERRRTGRPYLPAFCLYRQI